MQSSPIYALIYFFISAYLFKLWLGDAFFYAKNLEQRKGAFVGAYFAPKGLLGFAIFGSLFLLAVQCIGEGLLGFSDSQSKISYFSIFTFIAAAFVEELVFRGYLVFDKTKLHLVLSILVFSLIFALAHPFLWDFSTPAEGASLSEYSFSLDLSLKGAFYTFFIFINSIFFYLLRFNKFNPKRSLLPCFLGHLSYNIGVYLIKIAQGFVG